MTSFLNLKNKTKINKLCHLILILKFNEKPTYVSLFDTLKCLKMFRNTFNTTKLTMPRLALGLDRLNWETTFNMLKYVFCDTRIDITISTFTLIKHNISLVEPINVHLLQTHNGFL